MTPEVESYVDDKIAAIEKLITYQDDDEIRCDIELAHMRDQRAPVWRAEINLVVKGVLYRAEATGENVQAALDEMKDEIMKRVRRDKRKRFDFLKRGGLKLKEVLKFGRR
jgi:ribosomal subunit interface protein